ncbi:MAG: iron-containing alcohol dehydrogenase [Syntrophobacterales bacterium]|nr:iron-containing alcohol dehydrogenase [Syntrophobacterales bacterium]
MLAQFNVPSTIIVGAGASREAGAQAKRFGANRVLLVTDSYMEQCGLAGRICDSLKKEGIAASVFSGVQPDPTDRNVLDGLSEFKASKADILIGFGGGSSMDTAKVISILANNELPMSQYAAGPDKVPIANPGVPFMVIPTTAGTGSEVTKVAVISDTERDVKMMMLDINLLATAALLDYELTMTMPPALTANVGVDTLVHAVEAYVSKKANPMTDPIALSSIRLVAENLYTAFKEPENKKAREGMMLAACQGGMAFANSSVCLVHGMSRPIGALYHVPHGLSNAVLFPSVTEYSIAGASERYATVSRVMGCASEKDSDEVAGAALVKELQELNDKLEIPRLGECAGVELSVFDERVEKMANDGLASGSPDNNPVVPSVREIIELYHKAW